METSNENISMQDGEISNLSVTGLLSFKKTFSIPSYQRGYRWTSANIEALLNDLVEFAVSNEKTYCLQPIVLHERTDGSLGIVDGQQRLTTMYLILKQILANEFSPWKMRYDVEKKDLSELLSAGGDDINSQFRRAAIDAIDKWEPKKSFNLDKAHAIPILRNVLRKGKSETDQPKEVVFICYTIKKLRAKETEQNIFSRLNDGKIPLTSSELIRALFMTNIHNTHFQLEIAKEWELMEDTLRHEDFWSVFNTEKMYIATRMDLLFAIVSKCELNKIKTAPLAIYHEIEEKIRNGERLEDIWGKIRRVFWWMQSVYDDYECCNLLGWLTTFHPQKTTQIMQEHSFESCTKAKVAAKQNIKNLFPEYKIEDVNYGYDKKTLRELFVLLNVLESNSCKERFRFDLYIREENKEYTDHPNEPNNKKKYHGWQVEHIDAKNGATISKVNSINNLVLLDARTNEGYRDSCFAKKRNWIRKNLINNATKDEIDFFILPCTLKVFMKFYSSTEKESTYEQWTDSDGEQYLSAMKALFEHFMNN